jgi:excisionase family DNA binding protein
MADDEIPMERKPISPLLLGQPLDLHDLAELGFPAEWKPTRLTVLDDDLLVVQGIEASSSRFLTVKEVAEELRSSTKTIYRLLDDGALPAVQFKPGSPYLIERAELETFIESSRTTPSVHDIEPWQS